MQSNSNVSASQPEWGEGPGGGVAGWGAEGALFGEGTHVCNAQTLREKCDQTGWVTLGTSTVVTKYLTGPRLTEVNRQLRDRSLEEKET